jgi:broad specificity phosphatase PhoE/ribonuclease HI
MRVIVEADGGSRGNPGPAGYGAVVLDADHRTVLAERKGGIGRATNNVAEYRGLIAGLEAAAQVGAAEVEVRMDSKLVVMQMRGEWKVKHPDMIPLAQAARGQAATFAQVSYQWVPRSENARADRLANAAMDEAAAAAREPAAVSKPRSRPAEAPIETPAGTPAHGPGWTRQHGEPTRLLLLRHGQTELSVMRRYSGRGNPDLTELGHSQAESAALRLKQGGGIAAVLSSPLVRARRTAQYAADALGLPVAVRDGLIEADFGDWEGLTFTEASERDPELHRRWLADTSVRPPGGESFDEVHTRVRSALEEIVDRHAGQTVLVVSHVTPIKAILRMALQVGPSLLFRLHLDLASLSVAEFYPDGGASVRLVNDTSYL